MKTRSNIASLQINLLSLDLQRLKNLTFRQLIAFQPLHTGIMACSIAVCGCPSWSAPVFERTGLVYCQTCHHPQHFHTGYSPSSAMGKALIKSIPERYTDIRLARCRSSINLHRLSSPGTGSTKFSKRTLGSSAAVCSCS